MQDLVLDQKTKDFIELTAKSAFWNHIAALGWDLYFVAFAIGAALLLLYPLLPDPDKESGGNLPAWWQRLGHYRQQFCIAGTVVLLLLCAASHQTALDERRGFIADQDKRYEAEIKKLSAGKNKEEALRAQYLYMPEGNSLAYISLGNTSLAADYVWLTSFQYVSNSFRRGSKFEMLNRFYGAMMELEPNWIEAEINAGKVLSALEPDRFKVEKFYEQAILKNPDSEALAYEAGRLFVVPPLDPSQQERYSKRAVEWFHEALRKNTNLPPGPAREKRKKDIENQVARLSLESGPAFYEVADELLMKQVLDTESPVALRSASGRGWLTAHSLFVGSKVEAVAKAYKEKMGQFPPTLDPVFANMQHAEKFKNDAYGFPFEYDAATGKVSSRGVKARRTIQAASVITSLIADFRSGHNDTNPKDLVELQDYVRASYAQTPPGAAVTDAIGAELNTTVNPLGQPWNYDQKAGRVIPPPECDPTTLFKPADDLLNEVMASQKK